MDSALIKKRREFQPVRDDHPALVMLYGLHSYLVKKEGARKKKPLRKSKKRDRIKP